MERLIKKKALAVLLFLPVILSAKAQDSTSVQLAKAKLGVMKESRFYDPKKSFEIFQKYAHKGNADAMSALGNFYNTGEIVEKDDQEAFRWYQKAADLGSGNGWYNLALMYKNGVAVEQDTVKAFECYSRRRHQIRPACK